MSQFKQIHTITMKHLFLILLASIICFSVQGQNEESPIAGRKIITGSFNGNFRDQDNFNQSNINTSILIGKIKDNNTYIAFGGNFNYSSVDNNGIDNSTGLIGPAIESGKFVKLIDKLYLAPRIGGSFGVSIGDTSGFSANFYATPLRFMYNFTDKFFLTAGFAGAFVNFSNIDDVTNVNINGSLGNTASIGAFFTFK